MSEQVIYWEYSDHGYTVTTHRFITPNYTFDIAQIPMCYMRYSVERRIWGKALRWAIIGCLLILAMAGCTGISEGDTTVGWIVIGIAAAGIWIIPRFVKWGEYRVYHLYLDERETVGYQPVPTATYNYGTYSHTTNWNMMPITRGGNSVLSSRNIELVGSCHDAIHHAIRLERGYTLDL